MAEAVRRRILTGTTMLRVITGLLWFRACWAFGLFLFFMAYRAGMPGFGLVGESLAAFVHARPNTFFALWGLYVAGYLLAAILFRQRPWMALGVYLLAALIDFALWLSMSLSVEYQYLIEGWARALDGAFNAIDLILVGALLAFALRGVKPGPD
ncbi:hypothetical protein MACH15_10640 [Maricaulis maris]|jgi:hypothetical protein|nr:hypothetical protein MACH15_10640 [Maricaulis maris]